MGLLVLGPVGRVRELLGAVELLGELAGEGFVARVRAQVDLSVLQAGEGATATLELDTKVMMTFQ